MSPSNNSPDDDVNVVMIKYEIQIGLMLYKNSISSLSVIF